MSNTMNRLLILFILYSVIGWLIEVVICSAHAKRFVNRGFLWGPYCPIYGTGALVIQFCVSPLRQYPILVFAATFVLTTVLEYTTSWLMEKLFHMRWWDYSEKKIQLNGRVSLGTSTLFGIGGLLVVYGFNPIFTHWLDAMPAKRLNAVANLLAALFLLDMIVTLSRQFKFTERLSEIQKNLQNLLTLQKQQEFSGRIVDKIQALRHTYEKEPSGKSSEILSAIDNVLEKTRKKNRIIRAYPHIKTKEYKEAIRMLQEKVADSGASSTVKVKLKQWRDKSLRAGKIAAQGIRAQLNYTHLFWVFFLSGILGYMIETAYCLLTRGTLESRQGLLYGPFSQVYGLGAVWMALLLIPLAKRNDRWLFFGSAILGGAFEVICSYVQEAVFGSTSCHYPDVTVSLFGGRTSLLYMFFWGILGVWFVKWFYPKITKWINRIPRKPKRILTVSLSVFLALDMAVSAVAVGRWAERQSNIPANSQVSILLDEVYPDERMKDIYPNMIFR